MKDRFIELVYNAFRNAEEICRAVGCRDCQANVFDSHLCLTSLAVDSLLENGAILPPCKVGDTVWTLYGCHSFKIEKIEIFEDKMLFRCGNPGTDDYMAFYDFEIGDKIFFKKEEAEQRWLQILKEREG